MTALATVLVADDEKLARENLRHLLARRTDVTLIGECRTGAETISRIRESTPDIALLDIRMPDGGGLDVLRALDADERPVTLLVTAHPDHALEAFQYGVLDYLLKPFETARFNESLDRALRLLDGEYARDVVQRLARFTPTVPETAPAAGGDAAYHEPGAASAPREYRRRFLVRESERSRFVATRDVFWIEGDGPYVVLHTERGDVRIRMQMQRLEAELHPREFVRVHRSVMVRVDQILELYPFFHGDYEVRLRCGARVRLSRRRVGVLESLLKG